MAFFFFGGGGGAEPHDLAQASIAFFRYLPTAVRVLVNNSPRSRLLGSTEEHEKGKFLGCAAIKDRNPYLESRRNAVNLALPGVPRESKEPTQVDPYFYNAG